MQHKPAMAFATAAVLVLLGGCATPNQFANAVVDANVSQELAHNRLVLLNIVRAYKRMPMHFSKMTAARVPVGIGNPTFTMPTPFGPESLVLKYDWSTQLGIQQGVDSAPLDSQEFMRGITTPVSASTMIYYLDQGWPQQMILHLFVRSIEVFEKRDGNDVLIERFVNYPQNRHRFAEFQKALQGLAGCEIDAFSDRAPTPYGPRFEADRLGNLEALAAARTADLRLSPVDADGQVVSKPEQKIAGYQLFRDIRFTSLKFAKSIVESGACQVPSGPATGGVASSPTVLVNSPDKPQMLDKAAPGQRTTVFVLRSPEAMLYYLGEIGRLQLDGKAPDTPRFNYGGVRSESGTSDAVLFQLKREAGADSAVSVSHEGEMFSIPRSTSGNRSMHVVSLMTQMLGLHNKGNEPPGTLNVRAVP